MEKFKQVTLLVAAVLVLGAGCGEDERPTSAAEPTSRPSEATPTPTPTPKPKREAPRRGTRVVLGESEFGEMLFGARRQAIYIFENDPKGKTVCYGECARAWPPVLTEGRPVAGKGVDAGLLGAVERRDGTRQVTYAGRPLYYYAHEGPGEVRCHNVNLNGGFWWVVGRDGERLA
jgi:predicted lipoprotein with Yx(FWY)xxD motif